MHGERILTHSLALAAGLGIGWFAWLRTDSPRSGPDLAGALTDPAPHAAASTWLETRSERMRAAQAKSAGGGSLPFAASERLDIPALLAYERRMVDEERAPFEAEVDAVIAASAKYAADGDPASTIRALFRDDDWVSLLAAYHAWWRRDASAAGAFFKDHWGYFVESDLSGRLLLREFGKEQAVRWLLDSENPLRMRILLARTLGTHIGESSGLAEFLELERKVTSPRIKKCLIDQFESSWPLADPKETARLLATADATTRDRLLSAWSPGPDISIFRAFLPHPSMGPAHATAKWFKETRDAIPPHLLSKDILGNPCDPWYAHERKPLSGRTLADVLEEPDPGDPFAPGTAAEAITKMFEDTASGSPEITARFLTGQCNRAEFVASLTAAASGSEAYPRDAEIAAWKLISHKADAAVVMDWGWDFYRPGDFTWFKHSITPGEYDDARLNARLERTRAIYQHAFDEDLKNDLAQTFGHLLKEWKDISPAHAGSWLRSLPANDPLRDKAPQSIRSPEP